MLYRFGDFVLDLDLYELRQGDQRVELQPKVFEVLRFLLEHADRSVPKEELLDTLWPGVAVGDAVLTRAISQARRALGDADREDGIIRTVRGRGYGIAVPVELEADAPDAASPARDPDAAETPAEPERRLAALLCADAVGYGRLLGADELETVRTLTELRAEMVAGVEEHGGEVVDSARDTLLAELPSALEAVRCAQAIQSELDERNRTRAPDQRMPFRMGVHVGDVLVQDQHYGDGITAVAALARLAQPGGICVSGVVHEQVARHDETTWEHLGERTLGHLEQPTQIYRTYDPAFAEADPSAVTEVEDPPPTRAPEPTPRWGRTRRVALAVAAAIVALGAATFLLGRAPTVTPPSTPTERSRPAPRTAIAVLPFVDMSAGSAHEHVADGFTEEIITALAKVPSLRVTARTSAFAFKGRNEDVRRIGAQLGVGTVLEGSVRLAGSRMRVTAQLIEASTGFHLWTDVYERSPEHVFEIQEELAQRIAGELVERLEGPEAAPLVRPPAASFEAYQLYLKGRLVWAAKTQEAYREAAALYERALVLDPDYAPAHAGLSDVYRNTWSYWSSEPRDGPLLQRAEEEARRAMKLDPSSPQAHSSLASAVQDRYRDWDEAERLFQRSVELGPRLADLHLAYGTFLLIRGRLDEARAALGRALELDPLSPQIHTQVGRAAVYAGDSEMAVARLTRALELNPRDPLAPRLLYLAYQGLGQEERAREAYMRVAPPASQPALRALARIFGNRFVIARVTELALGYEPLSPDGPYGVAVALAYLGDDEQMYEQLALAERKSLEHIRLEPVFDPYRGSARFEALLERAGYAR